MKKINEAKLLLNKVKSSYSIKKLFVYEIEEFFRQINCNNFFILFLYAQKFEKTRAGFIFNTVVEFTLVQLFIMYCI